MMNDNSPQGYSRRSMLKSSGVFATILSAGLAGCTSGNQSSGNQSSGNQSSGNQSSGNQSSKTLKFNSATSKGSIQSQFGKWFANSVEKKSDGNLKIDMFYNGQLGNQNESVNSLSNGTIDFFNQSPGILAGQYKPIQVLDCPYLYKNYDHAIKETDPQKSKIAKDLSENLIEKVNVRMIGSIAQGTRRLTLSKKPAHKPSDLNGRKVRAIPVDVFNATVNGLGANAVNIDFSSLPTALSTGGAAGQENPYNVIWNSGIYSNQDYVIETDHHISPNALLMSEQTYQRLNRNQQKIIRRAFVENRSKALKTLKSNIPKYKKKIEENGLTIISSDEIDMNKFKHRTRKTIREKFPDFKQRLDKIHGSTYE